MSNPSKAIGTRAETTIRNYFNSRGIRCERKALAGSDDEGDLCLYIPTMDGEVEVTVEVKAGKQTQNYPRSRVEEWRRQTLVEAENSGCISMLVIVRYKRRLSDVEVWIPNEMWWKHDGWTMMYLSEFMDWIEEVREEE